jgi:integrase
VRRPRSLAVEQFHVLRGHFSTLALLSVCLGLRISEALALRWCDIDWLPSRLSIRCATVERHGDVPKTENSAETMMLSEELLSHLQLWRQRHNFQPSKTGCSPARQDRASAVFLHRSMAGITKGGRSGRDRRFGTHSFRPHVSELAGSGRDTAGCAAEGNAPYQHQDDHDLWRCGRREDRHWRRCRGWFLQMARRQHAGNPKPLKEWLLR